MDISIVWVAGVVIMLCYILISYLMLRIGVSASVRISEKVYECDDIRSPFILGVIRPRIYLPSGMDEVTKDSVLSHERMHIRRGDHFWKPFGFMILAVYWFNPLCWIAYIFLCRDIEYACDEKATRGLDKSARADYCQALLKCSINRRVSAACPVAFGEVGVKSRIKSVLNYKKPAFWIIMVAMMACIVMGICFLTNPKQEEAVSKESDREAVLSEDTVTEKNEESIDENGIQWLPENVFIRELGDLDGNGTNEYVKVDWENELPDYESHFTFYWNGDAIYEYDDLCLMDPGNAEYLDLDGDGEKEIFFPFYPYVNSMPLHEYIVLKQTDTTWIPLEMIHGETMLDNAFPITVTKGDQEWQASISCDRLDKNVIYDVELHYLDLKNEMQYVEEHGGETEYISELITRYENEFTDYPVGEICGKVSMWGIWEIKTGDFEGRPCLIASHGIQCYDKFDFWGIADVYFDYDMNGNTRVLNIQFSPENSYSEQN